ncbi:hypothetical protein Pint_35792 [Pistacia integerrima]|uniref:Uncharacterized protein n=1 Tax=Pistacia integerrima TaxID=434235 RepID=A0ACC0Y3G1_9ROSI|nr:hypothetical protein Pint_35792 [Pistacia integerrima]
MQTSNPVIFSLRVIVTAIYLSDSDNQSGEISYASLSSYYIYSSRHFHWITESVPMEKNLLPFLFLLFSSSLLHGYLAFGAGTDDGSEQWGYVEVRPKGHLFWWLYKSPYRVEDPSKPWPTLLWIQGGPGVSGVGLGNFIEIGPLDGYLQPRNSTWLKKADLLFVDSPVGTGFSYIDGDDENLLVRTDEAAATDLTTLLKVLFNGNQTLQKSPLYIFAESYGGKFAATLGVSTVRAMEAGELKLQLGGVALGNTWISPEDFVV